MSFASNSARRSRPHRACGLGIVGFLSFAPTLAAQTAENALVGAWEAREYALASGDTHPLRGRIMFTSEEWQVLFFVLDGDEPRRASAEGGRYTLEDGRLTFEHLFHFASGDALPGLEATPLTMTARSSAGPLEPTDIEVEGASLVLRFPSGNSMMFDRSSTP